MHALKAPKLLDRARHRAHELVNIELHHLVSFAAARIGDVYTRSRGLCRRDLCRLDAKIVETERGVAEAKTKWKERLAGCENVCAIARRLVIVEGRKLAHRARKRDWQFAPGIDVAKKHLRGGRSAFLAQIPSFKNGRDMLRRVIDRKRTAIDQENYGWDVGLNDCLNELILCAQKVERIPVAEMLFRPGFAICAFGFAHDDDGDVGLLGNRCSGADALALRFRIG